MIRLRAERPGDHALLRHLYAAARAEEVARTGWPAPMREAFLDQQFALRQEAYRGAYPADCFHIVERDAAPVGSLILHVGDTEVRVVDIVLLPEVRGMGIGTGLIRDAMALAEQAGLPLTLHVDVGSRARAWYLRLGFEVVQSTNGIYELLRWA